MASSSEKRCLYEVLALKMDCTTDEIRSAYKKLALQRHPDKLIKSGLSQTEATAQFQELSHAYEVLSDPKERAFYDSHRSQILFSNPSSVPDSTIPNLFSYFSNTVYNGYTNSNKGFYSVYYDVFTKVYLNEISYCKKLGLGVDLVREAPIMGDLESLYSQVTAFYSYWLGFSTVMDFCWVDQYDVMAGVNRKSRRVMEEENKKVRKKARREYNETVRDLAEFVKKRDKRVIDMAVKRKEEEERRKEEERERKRKAERERMERVREYEEPEWARVEEDEIVEDEEEEEERRNEGKELYCVVCSKKFKSEKQWKNHEQSKKHREKVAELRESFVDEDEDREEDFEEFRNGKVEEDNVEELGERLKEGLGIEEEEGENGVGGLSGGDDEEEDGFFDVKEGVDGGEDHDEEMSVLEAMVSGHKSRRKNVGSRREDEDLTREVHVENESEEEVLEYNNRKSTGKNREGKKERGKKNGGGDTKGDVDDEDLTKEVRVENESEEEVMEYNNRKSTRRNRRAKKNGGGDMKGDVDETKGGQSKENNGQDDSHMEESSFVENESNGKRDDDQLGKSHNSSNQTVDKRGNAKKDTKSKSSSKGKKAKVSAVTFYAPPLSLIMSICLVLYNVLGC